MNKHLRSAEYLIFEVSDRVARTTLNRPETRNALFPKLLAELRDALLEADYRNDVNVIILQGAGKDSCAGYDPKVSAEQPLRGSQRRADRRRTRRASEKCVPRRSAALSSDEEPQVENRSIYHTSLSVYEEFLPSIETVRTAERAAK